MNSFTGRFVHLLQRFTRSQRGNVAMIAGIALPVLLMISAGAIDLHNAAKVKSELQDALDAATLAAARSNGTTNAEVQKVGMASLKANMPNYFLTNPGDVASFTVNDRTEVQATATVQVKTIIANVFLPPYGQLFDDYLPMGASSNVLRASRNVEVAMALDVTGSMSDGVDYMPDLRAAATELAGIVVQGDQSLFTTRVALVPYAGGVNVGDFANALRGSMRDQLTDVTKSEWAQSPTSITGVSGQTLTARNHGLKVGDPVFLTGFSTRGNLNETARIVKKVTSADNFELEGSYSSTDLGGSSRAVRKCETEGCYTVLTSVNHSLVTGEIAQITNTSGVTGLNDRHPVTVIDENRFSVPLVGYNRGNLSRNGKVECGRDGCQNRMFRHIRNSTKVDYYTRLPATTCVSERPRGNNAPSEAAPSSTTYVGRAYLSSSNNPCPSAQFIPLTNQLTGKGGLNETIKTYRAGGSTAGQVGIEMAWYAVSPTFGSVFPAASRPNAYNTAETVKAVILMTDGEFNTPFCEGVIARNAGSGSGNDEFKINCNATNGEGFAQSVQLCAAMKAQGIVVYTVGFNLKLTSISGPIDTAYEVMHNCATNPNETFFPAATGTDLKEAFKSIGRDITRLRIAR